MNESAYDLEEMNDQEDSREVSGALSQITSSEIESQIAVSKRWPRSIRTFQREATEMVTLSEEIASECMYALPRGGKKIEGPSARFAEIIVSAWGNCRAGARVMGDDGKFVTAQGFFFDTQRNVAITYEVQRRVTDKNGKRFADDMIGVTANAACSIALRNAILKGVPKAFWKGLYDKARECAIGNAETLGERRTKMLQYFAKMGVQPDRVFTLLEIAGEQDITLDQLAQLKGLATSIKDGDTTVDQAFDMTPPEKPGAKKAAPLDTSRSKPNGVKHHVGPEENSDSLETANPKWAEFARQYAMATDADSVALVFKSIKYDDPDDEAESARLRDEAIKRVSAKKK